MRKKTFWIIIGALTLSLVIVLMCHGIMKSKNVIPVFESGNMYFGMTPGKVTSVLGAPKETDFDVCDTPDDLCLYETVVMGNVASVECFFTNNRYLRQVNILWSFQSSESSMEHYRQIYDMIFDKYSGNEYFFENTTEEPGEITKTMGLNQGATGIVYTISVTDDSVRIVCVNDM